MCLYIQLYSTQLHLHTDWVCLHVQTTVTVHAHDCHKTKQNKTNTSCVLISSFRWYHCFFLIHLKASSTPTWLFFTIWLFFCFWRELDRMLSSIGLAARRRISLHWILLNSSQEFRFCLTICFHIKRTGWKFNTALFKQKYTSQQFFLGFKQNLAGTSQPK